MKLFSLNFKGGFNIIKFLIESPMIKEAVEHDHKLLQIPKVIKWLHSHGVQITKPPPHAVGSRGVVYFLGDKVVKFTDEPVEAKLAKLLEGDKFVSIIDVIQVDNKLWAILQRQVSFNRSNKISRGFDYLATYMDDHGKESVLDGNVIDKINSEWPDSINADVETAVEMVLHIYKETGHIIDDPDISNIGFDNGKPLITDLGPK